MKREKWQCVSCGLENDISTDICSSCKRSSYEIGAVDREPFNIFAQPDVNSPKWQINFHNIMRHKRRLLVLSLTLYAFSLPLAVFHYGGSSSTRGIEILMVGWLGLLVLDVRWYANLFYFYGMARLFSGKKTFAAAVVAVAIGSLTFFLPINHYPDEGRIFRVLYLGLGAYFWFFSLLIALAVAVYEKKGPDALRALNKK